MFLEIYTGIRNIGAMGGDLTAGAGWVHRNEREKKPDFSVFY